VLVVEDVLTTGKSTRETIDVAREAGAQVAGAAAIVDRSGGTIDLGVPTYTLVQLQVPTYDAAQCPLCAEGKPVMKPGSRPT
jgi:orotate phosphoribosyltransferase